MTRGGEGLIETIRVRGRQLPFLERHLARVNSSLRALGRPGPPGDLAQRVRAAAAPPELGGADHVIRVALLDGTPAIATRELPHLNPPAVIVGTEPHTPYPHKTTARGVFDRAILEAQAQGADDALLVTAAGHIAEGTAWSVFWWQGDRVYTPALDLGILPGVGRARVMELMEVTEARVTAAEFVGRSLFLVNAVRGIVPIGSFRGRDVHLDSRTAELSHRFWPD
ncbi:MAG TPA: aminotransferase class IV [Gemmatimonadales bacterium]|nr:aminotransferase class IV [Gemmatimonadales bacterium]